MHSLYLKDAYFILNGLLNYEMAFISLYLILSVLRFIVSFQQLPQGSLLHFQKMFSLHIASKYI